MAFNEARGGLGVATHWWLSNHSGRESGAAFDKGVGGVGFLLLGRGAHLFESAEIAPALKGFRDEPAVKGHEAGIVFGQNRIR